MRYFPKAYKWLKGYFISQGKGRGLNEAGKKKSAGACQWQEGSLSASQMWFQLRETPMATFGGMLLPALQWCQYHCLHSHTWDQDQIWLPRMKHNPESMGSFHSSFFFHSLPLLFLSETGSPIRVTAELHHCAGTTVRDVHTSTGWEQGRWIHLVKTQFKPVLPARDRFI